MKAFVWGFVLLSGVPAALAGEEKGAGAQKPLSAAVESATIGQAALAAIDELEAKLAESEAVQGKLHEAAEEVRRAQQGWQDSSGALARMVALDRLRTARQNHHQAAQQKKEFRQSLSRALQSVARHVTQLEAEIEAQAEPAAGRRGRLRVQRQQIEQRLERLGPSIQQEMEQPGFGQRFAPPFIYPYLPPPEKMPPPPGAPDAPDTSFRRGGPRDERQGRRGWTFLREHQQRMEAMEQRIQQLEQHVERLQKDLQQMEAGEDEDRGSRPPSR